MMDGARRDSAWLPVLAMVAFLWLGGWLTPLESADYYVAVQGDDRAAGSASKPFRTIQRGLAAATVPGDRVILRAGEYFPATTVNLASPGKPGAFIALQAATGERVIIDGSRAPTGTNLVAVLAAYVRVEGLEVRNSPGTGITVWGAGSRVHRVEVRGNRVEDCENGGIYAGSPQTDDPVRDILVEDNAVTRTSLMNEERGLRGRWAFGAGGGGTAGMILRNNRVFENHGEGIGLFLSSGGLIEGNEVFDNFAVNIYLDNTTDTGVHGNFCYSTGQRAFFRQGKPTNGIQIANETYPRANPSARNRITHNLLVGNGAAFYYGAYQEGGGLRETLFAHNTVYGAEGDLIMVDADAGHRRSRFVNNLFVQLGPKPMIYLPQPTPELVFQNNLWFGGTPRPAARSDSDLLADPRFENPGGLDPSGYRLRQDSPARRRGLTLDLPATRKAGLGARGGEGSATPNEGPPDLGAWQAGE